MNHHHHHHPAHTDTHPASQPAREPARVPPPIRLAEDHIPMEFLFFTLQTVFIHDIKMASVRHGSRPPYLLTEPLSTALFLLPSRALALCCCQSAPPPTPVPAVMIMSARLLSCQTHRIYSGLFLMFTLMLLLFTRKGGKWLRFSAASYTHAGVSSCRLTA